MQATVTDTEFSRFLSWSPDGSQLVTGYGVLDATTLSVLHFAQHCGGTTWATAAWSHDSTLLAIGCSSNDGHLVVLDATNSSYPVVYSSEPLLGVESVSWSPNGFLAVGTQKEAGGVGQRQLFVLDPNNGYARYFAAIGVQDIVHALDWSPNGMRLAAGSDSMVRVFDLSNSLSVVRTDTASSPEIDPRCVAFSPSGTRLAIGSVCLDLVVLVSTLALLGRRCGNVSCLGRNQRVRRALL
jgi:WD40 repeat protein